MEDKVLGSEVGRHPAKMDAAAMSERWKAVIRLSPMKVAAGFPASL